MNGSLIRGAQWINTRGLVGSQRGIFDKWYQGCYTRLGYDPSTSRADEQNEVPVMERVRSSWTRVSHVADADRVSLLLPHNVHNMQLAAPHSAPHFAHRPARLPPPRRAVR
jgi:hypothetical protein